MGAPFSWGGQGGLLPDVRYGASPQDRVMWSHYDLEGLELSGTRIASQNRNDHGGRKRARNQSAAEIAGSFASVAANKSLAASDFWGYPQNRRKLAATMGRKSPQPRDIGKGTKEYLNQRGTKIRVFRVFFSGLFPSTLFPSFFPPLSPSGPVHSPTTSPLFTSPFHPPPFLTPGKLRFRYPSDLGTL